MHGLTRSQRNKALGLRPGPSVHDVDLRLDAFNKWMKSLDLVANAAIAEYLELGEGTISRLRTTDEHGAPLHKPGRSTISAIRKKLPEGKTLDDYLDFGLVAA